MQHLQATLCALCAAFLLAACASTDKAAVREYPLDSCIVTDNALGSMGDPIYKVYDGQQVAFCCKPCIAEFEQDPAMYLAKLPK
jgi:hypothetical protein